jgi:hypothetical protein
MEAVCSSETSEAFSTTTLRQSREQKYHKIRIAIKPETFFLQGFSRFVVACLSIVVVNEVAERLVMLQNAVC